MKSKNSIHVLLVAVAAITFSSCTKKFEETNTDRTRITALTGNQVDKLFSIAQYTGSLYPAGYQTIQSLFADMQAQYFSITQKNFPSDRNVIVGNWLDGSWGAFLNGGNNLNAVLKAVGPDGGDAADPVKEAVAKIWKVYIYLPMTDYFGPIPYSEVGNEQDVVLYDSQEEIYMDFFKTLTEATATINTNLSRGKAMETGDNIYGGDLSKWLKMGNSLRLRIALRVSKVNPTLAKSESESAIAAPGGLVLDNTDNGFLKPTPPTYVNPIGQMSEWGEFRMSASMQSLLQGYNDPREPQFFSPAKNTGQFKGIRNGLTQEQMALDPNSNDNNSNVHPRFQNLSMTSEPFGIIMAAESWFNIAEASLNGWTTGYTAQEAYENGIRRSFEQWAAPGADAYIASTNTPVPLGDQYSTPAVSDIPVAFSGNPAKQLEQIITQKWLASYPFGSPNAWAEFRRTGFPKLLPRLNSDNTAAPVEAGSIRRLSFPSIRGDH